MTALVGAVLFRELANNAGLALYTQRDIASTETTETNQIVLVGSTQGPTGSRSPDLITYVGAVAIGIPKNCIS